MKFQATTLMIALALPVAAAAQCPTAADLDGAGITLIHDDGSIETFTTEAPGVTKIFARYSDGYQAENLYVHGVHLLQLADAYNGVIDRSSAVIYAYPMPPTEMPVPEAGMSWEVDYALNDRGNFYNETQVQQWGPAEQMTFGDCTYEVIEGMIGYRYEDGGSHMEGLMYFPELGISFLTLWQDPSMAQPDTYTLEEIVVGTP